MGTLDRGHAISSNLLTPVILACRSFWCWERFNRYAARVGRRGLARFGGGFLNITFRWCWITMNKSEGNHVGNRVNAEEYFWNPITGWRLQTGQTLKRGVGGFCGPSTCALPGPALQAASADPLCYSITSLPSLPWICPTLAFSRLESMSGSQGWLETPIGQ